MKNIFNSGAQTLKPFHL